MITFRSQIDRDLSSKQNERKDVAMLPMKVSKRWNLLLHTPTLAWQSAKNLKGSMPYATALPMMGIQWNTTGGLYLLGTTLCLSTLAAMVSTEIVARAMKTAKIHSIDSGLKPENESLSMLRYYALKNLHDVEIVYQKYMTEYRVSKKEAREKFFRPPMPRIC